MAIRKTLEAITIAAILSGCSREQTAPRDINPVRVQIQKEQNVLSSSSGGNKYVIEFKTPNGKTYTAVVYHSFSGPKTPEALSLRIEQGSWIELPANALISERFSPEGIGWVYASEITVVEKGE